MLNKHKKFKGFTLAEVLITLVIIGVIAGMTIPTLIANFKREEVSSKLKKFYSTLSQACMEAKAAGNDWELWASEAPPSIDESGQVAENFAKEYLLPYINYTKTQHMGYNYVIVLSDGAMFSVQKGDCLNFEYDVNGLYKNPNQQGRDAFVFLYCPYGIDYWQAVLHVGPALPSHINTRDLALESCKRDPLTCTGLLEMDSWEFKPDYPHRI